MATTSLFLGSMQEQHFKSYYNVFSTPRLSECHFVKYRNEKTKEKTVLVGFTSLQVPESVLFENALQAGGICERRFFVFVWTENILKAELFENDGVTIIPCDFPDRVFLKHKSKMTGDCVFKFLRRSVDGKHLIRLKSKTSVFKFLQRNVNGT